MKSQKIQEMSNEGLLKQKKSIEVVTGTLAGLLTVLLVMIVLLSIKKGLDATSIALSVIPFALMPIVFLNWNNLKEIKKELNSRKNVV